MPLPEKVICPACNTFMGLIRSDGTGPILNCPRKSGICALFERLLPYQPVKRKYVRTFVPVPQPPTQEPLPQKDDLVCNCGATIPRELDPIAQLETDGAPPLDKSEEIA